jgi:guanylate kinase
VALAERLNGRAQDAREVIDRRMAQATAEMSHYREYDQVVVNDDFEAALADLVAIITGRGRPRPLSIDIKSLLRTVENPA